VGSFVLFLANSTFGLPYSTFISMDEHSIKVMQVDIRLIILERCVLAAIPEAPKKKYVMFDEGA
jgi:hypothetical protein